jgi:hypothetical protein
MLGDDQPSARAAAPALVRHIRDVVAKVGGEWLIAEKDIMGWRAPCCTGWGAVMLGFYFRVAPRSGRCG